MVRIQHAIHYKHMGVDRHIIFKVGGWGGDLVIYVHKAHEKFTLLYPEPLKYALKSTISAIISQFLVHFWLCNYHNPMFRLMTTRIMF